eukprot:s171_g34.t1
MSSSLRNRRPRTQDFFVFLEESKSHFLKVSKSQDSFFFVFFEESKSQDSFFFVFLEESKSQDFFLFFEESKSQDFLKDSVSGGQAESVFQWSFRAAV